MLLKGGKRTIMKHKPTILVEIKGEWLKRYDTKPDEVDTYLKKFLGYDSYIVSGRKLVKVNHINNTVNNYFYIHNDRPV